MSKFIKLTIEQDNSDTETLFINSDEIIGFYPLYGELHTTQDGNGSMVWISESLQYSLCNSLGSLHNKPKFGWLHVCETPGQIWAQLNN